MGRYEAAEKPSSHSSGSHAAGPIRRSNVRNKTAKTASTIDKVNTMENNICCQRPPILTRIQNIGLFEEMQILNYVAYITAPGRAAGFRSAHAGASAPVPARRPYSSDGRR